MSKVLVIVVPLYLSIIFYIWSTEQTQEESKRTSEKINRMIQLQEEMLKELKEIRKSNCSLDEKIRNLPIESPKKQNRIGQILKELLGVY